MVTHTNICRRFVPLWDQVEIGSLATPVDSCCHSPRDLLYGCNTLEEHVPNNFKKQQLITNKCSVALLQMLEEDFEM